MHKLHVYSGRPPYTPYAPALQQVVLDFVQLIESDEKVDIESITTVS